MVGIFILSTFIICIIVDVLILLNPAKTDQKSGQN